MCPKDMDFGRSGEACNKHIQMNFIMAGGRRHMQVRASTEFILVYGEGGVERGWGVLIIFANYTNFSPSKTLLCLCKVCLLHLQSENPRWCRRDAVSDRGYHLPWVYWGRKQC